MMNKTMNTNRLFGLVFLILAALLLTVAPVSSAQRGGGSSLYFSDKDNAGKQDVSRQNAYVGAIEKTGFYGGIDNERVSILDEKTYRKLSYLVAPDLLVVYFDPELELEQEIELGSLLPHSIVQLIVVDVEVVKIVLLQESS